MTRNAPPYNTIQYNTIQYPHTPFFGTRKRGGKAKCHGIVHSRRQLPYNNYNQQYINNKRSVSASIMAHPKSWFNDWKHKRQSKVLSRKLNRRLEKAGQVQQLLLNNVKLHAGVMQSIQHSIRQSYMPAFGGGGGGGYLKILSVKDCFLKDPATVRGLVDLLQSQRGQVQRVTLLRNALNATNPLTHHHLNALLEALGVVKHLTLGPEFCILLSQEQRRGNHRHHRQHQQDQQHQPPHLLQKACERAITLQIVNVTDDDNNNPPNDAQIPASIRLRGLYEGLQSHQCRVQTLILQGSLLDDKRFTLLVDSILASSSTGNHPPAHLTLPGQHLHVRSCATLIRLLQHDSYLEHLEMNVCAFFKAISTEQAQDLGTVLAHDTHLEHLKLRDVYLTDTLAVPVFESLRTNQILQTLVLTTHFDDSHSHHRHRQRFPPVSTMGYQALSCVLPKIKHLTTLHLGRDFFTTLSRGVASADFVANMKRAMYANGSIQVYESDSDDIDIGLSTSSSPRFGPYQDDLLYCMKRNRASLVASALSMMSHDTHITPDTALDASTWHAILLHMSAAVERQTALYQIVQRVMTDPQVLSLWREEVAKRNDKKRSRQKGIMVEEQGSKVVGYKPVRMGAQCPAADVV
uniref:Uncharacterized protein n=1 Tax=Amphora coffeiformis TaxID=265554 RepID=A0A7S3L2I5_9STRA